MIMNFNHRPSPHFLSAWAVFLLLSGLHVASCPATALAEDRKGNESGPWISSVAWVDDSTLVATRSQGLLLRPASVVKVATDRLDELEEIGESETSLWSVVRAGDGRYLASDYKGGLLLYGNDEPQKLEIDARWIRALEIAPGNELCLAGTEDGKLIVIQLADGTEKQRIEAGGSAIFDIAFHPNGDQVAISCGDGAVRLFTWPGLEGAGEMSRNGGALWSLIYSQDGSSIITGGADRRLQLWDVATQQSKLTLTKTPDWVTSLVRLPDSSLVVAACLNGAVVVADYQALVPVVESQFASSGIWGMALSPDGKTLAAGTRKSGIVTRATDDWRSKAEEVVAQLAAEAPPTP
jgi:WD40 repeat protein